MLKHLIKKAILAKSPIQHVWVGTDSSHTAAGTGSVTWTPVTPTKNDTILITVVNVTQGGKLHWGLNNATKWTTPIKQYWPAGSALYTDNVAVETPFNGPKKDTITLKIGPFNNSSQAVSLVAFDIHYNDGSWDNNNSKNYIININSGTIGNISWKPISPTENDKITIKVSKATKGGNLHWGVNSWVLPNNSCCPQGQPLLLMANQSKVLFQDLQMIHYQSL